MGVNYTFKSDIFRKKRGGWSRVLEINCKNCATFLFYYQKDGPGILKRSYLDRIIHQKIHFDKNSYFRCRKCNAVLGFNEAYTKEEGRPAIRWAVDAVKYHIVKSNI